MGITGVGSSYNFVYNTKTGKLSTKDGSKNGGIGRYFNFYRSDG